MSVMGLQPAQTAPQTFTLTVASVINAVPMDRIKNQMIVSFALYPIAQSVQALQEYAQSVGRDFIYTIMATHAILAELVN
jgi:hypothetical protein